VVGGETAQAVEDRDGESFGVVDGYECVGPVCLGQEGEVLACCVEAVGATAVQAEVESATERADDAIGGARPVANWTRW